jgi:hypothetical protein
MQSQSLPLVARLAHRIFSCYVLVGELNRQPHQRGQLSVKHVYRPPNFPGTLDPRSVEHLDGHVRVHTLEQSSPDSLSNLYGSTQQSSRDLIELATYHIVRPISEVHALQIQRCAAQDLGRRKGVLPELGDVWQKPHCMLEILDPRKPSI